MHDHIASYSYIYFENVIIEFVSIKFSYIWSSTFTSWKYANYNPESISNYWFMNSLLILHFTDQRRQLSIFSDNIIDIIIDDMKLSDAKILFKVAIFW